MKKLLALISILVLSVFALGACGSPCDKAFDKYVKCLEERKVPEKRIKRFKSKTYPVLGSISPFSVTSRP